MISDLSVVRGGLYGKCRVWFLRNQVLSADGTRRSLSDACQDCSAQCGAVNDEHALVGERLAIQVSQKPSGQKLTWDCPGCGHEVSEDAPSPAALFSLVHEIESDPLCSTCREKLKRCM